MSHCNDSDAIVVTVESILLLFNVDHLIFFLKGMHGFAKM